MAATDYTDTSLNSTGFKSERVRAGSTVVTAGSTTIRADGFNSSEDFFKTVIKNATDNSDQSINATNYS